MLLDYKNPSGRDFSDKLYIVLQVQMSVYFLGHVLFIAAFLSVPYLRKVFVPKKERGQLKQD